MGPVDGAQFAYGPLRMLVDGPLGDVENFADFPGRFAVRNPAENLALASRQLVFMVCRRARAVPPCIAFPSLGLQTEAGPMRPHLSSIYAGKFLGE